MTVLDGPGIIEMLAEAIYARPDLADQQPWADLPDRFKPFWRGKAEAALAMLNKIAERPQQWPDIGVHPLAGDRSPTMSADGERRVREAYVKQQPHVPHQAALVWRWDIGNLLMQLQRAEMLVSIYQREEDERRAGVKADR